VRLMATPGHTAEDITTLVETSDGLVACTHLWWSEEGPAQDPPGPSEGQVKLTRGASWDDVPQYQRVSFNHKGRVQLKDPTLGFRCVWNSPKP